MQARAVAVGNGEVMHIALAMHPGCGNAAVWSVFLAILCQPKTQSRVEVDGVLNFGREHIEMVEPLRVTSFVEIVTPQQMRPLLHRCIKLNLEAERIGELQRAPLKRLLHKCVSNPLFGKERGGLVEIVFIADLEPQAVAG